MIVTVLEIVAKIKDLPVDFAKYVRLLENNTAEVKSFSNPSAKPYLVQIKLAEKDGSREVTCTCQETEAWKELCDHVVAYYAVAKGIKPDGSVESTKKDTKPKDETKQSTSEEIAADELQQFALASRAMKATVLAEIAALFDKLAEELQKMKAGMEDKK